MITLKQLHYALAVEQTLHFKKAAEACFVSPSTLSNALTELEQQIGIQIFERDNKKVIVTALGKAVLEKAQTIKIGDQIGVRIDAGCLGTKVHRLCPLAK